LAAAVRNIVLVPGYMLDDDLWADVAEGLAQAGNLWHADLSRDATIEDMALRLLEAAPERFVLVGFSMGGYVAREVVRLAPTRVAALILIATSSRGDAEVQAQRKATVARAPSSSKFGGLSRGAILSSLGTAHANEPLIARIRAMSVRLGGGVFMRQSSVVRTGDTDQLGSIRCPTLIIAAADDRLRSLDEATELHTGIPGSKLAVIPSAGHMIPLEVPSELLDVILPWLSALPLAGATEC
jgi:pimeloyl-ACP methyl ester carboxylesterase